RQQAVEELVRALAAQRHRQADGHALAQLEVRDRLARAADVRLLPGDRRELLLRLLEQLGVLLGVADAHVERDLLDLRRLHYRRVAEALHQRRPDLLEVAGLHPSGCGGCWRHQIFAPDRLAARSRLPCSTTVFTRVGFLLFGSRSATFETWIGPSFSMTPPGSIDPGRAFWWRLMMFRPST